MRTGLQVNLRRGIPLLIWLWAGTAAAQTICADFWALPKFSSKQCGLAIQAANAARVPCLRTVYKAFGEDMSCLKRFVRANKRRRHVVQVFVANETCHRAGRKCTKHDTPTYKKPFSGGYVQVNNTLARQYADRFEALKTKLEVFKNEQTEIVYPVGLEDDFTRQGWGKIGRAIRERSPKSLLVRNPRRDLLPVDLHHADFNELHSSIPTGGGPPCIFGNDGRDIDFGTRRRPAGNPYTLPEARERIWSATGNCYYTGVWFDAQGVSNAWRSSRGRFVYPRSRVIGDISADLRKLKAFIKEIDASM